jgi:hypothetical protein
MLAALRCAAHPHVLPAPHHRQGLMEELENRGFLDQLK